MKPEAMAFYRIRKADGQEYGPVTAEMIRQWLADGFAFPRTLAREEGTREWKELAQFPEISALPPPVRQATNTPIALPLPSVPEDSPEAAPDEFLAKTSLGLGIASILTLIFAIGFLLAIPAIITGHLAYRRARKYPAAYGGEKKAKTGMVMGYAVLCMLVFGITVAIPNFHRARLVASSRLCLEHLAAISQANLAYSREHDNMLAPDFLSLSIQLRNPFYLLCPSLREYPNWDEHTDWSHLAPGWFSYAYLTPGSPVAAASNQAVVLCPRHGHVAHGDGRVVPGKSFPVPATPQPR